MRRAAFLRHLAALSVAAGLAACGSFSHNELPDDLDGYWVVQQIAGASLGGGVEIYLDIDASTGQIAGFTGCNRFTATMTAFSDALAVGAIQEQSGECASPQAATDEARFLGVLPSVHRFLRRGKSLELLPQQQGEALLRLRVDNLGTLTRPVTESPAP